MSGFVYRVQFAEPPLADSMKTEFFFSSLSAIYERFTAEQVGCKVSRLWNIGVSDGKPYEGRRCRITKEPVHAKTQNKPV